MMYWNEKRSAAERTGIDFAYYLLLFFLWVLWAITLVFLGLFFPPKSWFREARSKSEL